MAQLAASRISGRLLDAPAAVRRMVAATIIQGFGATVIANVEDLEEHGKPETEH